MRTYALVASAFGVVGAVLAGLYLWPKSCVLGGGTVETGGGSLTAASNTGYYFGFGLINKPGILFGKNYYRVRLAPTADEDGFTDVVFAGEGWNTFRGTYPNGTLREEGVCRVYWNGTFSGGLEPDPDLSDVKDGKYYDPTGKLASEVKNGTGVQTYWNCKGIKIWELELKDFKRARVSQWHDDGQPIKAHK